MNIDRCPRLDPHRVHQFVIHGSPGIDVMCPGLQVSDEAELAESREVIPQLLADRIEAAEEIDALAAEAEKWRAVADSASDARLRLEARLCALLDANPDMVRTAEVREILGPCRGDRRTTSFWSLLAGAWEQGHAAALDGQYDHEARAIERHPSNPYREALR